MMVSRLFDLSHYLIGKTDHIYQMVVIWNGGEHVQQMQTQHDQHGYYTVKMHPLAVVAEWEHLWYDDAYIYRGADCSPGDGQVYVQYADADTYGARWAKRFMSLDDRYTRTPLVRWYTKDGTPLSHKDARIQSQIVLRAHHHSLKLASGITVHDVIELRWEFNPDDKAEWAERYFYARDIGLVQWVSASGGNHSYMSVYRTSDKPQARLPLPWLTLPVVDTPAPGEPVPPPVEVPCDNATPMQVRMSDNVIWRLRGEPGIFGAVVGSVRNGDSVHVCADVEPVQADGYVWRKLAHDYGTAWIGTDPSVCDLVSVVEGDIIAELQSLQMMLKAMSDKIAEMLEAQLKTPV